MPNIVHRAGEQRPCLAPIRPVVIDYFADRPRPDRLDDRAGRNPPGRPINRSAGLIAPSRVVINAVGRVGDHKVRPAWSERLKAPRMMPPPSTSSSRGFDAGPPVEDGVIEPG